MSRFAPGDSLWGPTAAIGDQKGMGTMGLYFYKQWERARAEGARYHVVVCWAVWQTSCPKARDTEHTFTCKATAERFARTISRYLPGPGMFGATAWVLVSALATNERTARSCGTSLCYASYEAGGAIGKYHAPCAGYFGAPRTACARGPVDSLV